MHAIPEGESQKLAEHVYVHAGKDTSSFSSPDASGSTSQAANIQEALELGASCLILDEDVCATNFMIRDMCAFLCSCLLTSLVPQTRPKLLIPTRRHRRRI